MTLNEYQQRAMTTCMPSCQNIPYMLFNLQGEVGELSGKVAKLIRKKKMFFTTWGNTADTFCHASLLGVSELEKQEIMLEISDCAWQLAGLCTVLGLKLDDVCQANLDKLASRKQRGTIDGNGDFR